MSATQRWIVFAVVVLMLVIGLAAALVFPGSRFGSLPPNSPPLPCGDAVLTSSRFGSITKAVCLRGHVWFYERDRWDTTPAVPDPKP